MRRSRAGFLSPVVRRLLAEHGLDANEIEGTGNGGRVTRADVEAVLAARAADAPTEATPVVAPADAPEGDAGVAPPEPDAPVGSAPPDVGTTSAVEVPTVEAEPPPPPVRVSAPRDDEPVVAPEPDVEREPAAAPAPAPVATAPSSTDAGETLVPFSKIRTRIATNLRESVSTAAHAFCAVEADFERVDRVRRARAEQWKAREGFSLTYLPFVARAVCQALAEMPNLNASVVGEGLLVRHRVHLGIAVDLDHEGLIVPVVRDAARLRVVEMARAITDLARRARDNRLSPDDVVGGTFTVTNPGPSGTILSVPIINQPQVGILATDTVRRRPVMVPTGDGGEGIAVHSVGTLGLSFDHRGVDGAYAASFVSRVAELLRTHDWEPELTP